jgi:hypothetical protein
MKTCGLVVLVLLSIFACAPAGWGQAQSTTATVQGDVLDEKGGSVPDASIQATNLDTNYVRAETSNADGHFAFLNLIPGRYTLTISKPGFATILQENVNLTVGQVATIPVTMKVSAVSQQIVVSEIPIV